jgi:hypothetical protein
VTAPVVAIYATQAITSAAPMSFRMVVVALASSSVGA